MPALGSCRQLVRGARRCFCSRAQSKCGCEEIFRQDRTRHGTSPGAQRRPETLTDIREALIGPNYAGLRLIEDAETIEVRGTFPVLDGNDVLDQYEALIRFSEAYPDDPPEVWETGGRIPRLADLSQTDRALFWGRQFLNPYALEGLPEAGQAQV